MAQFKDKYHKAARDGYLDILREASRKDCDTRDEDGMTPVMWSSFYGRLDALRLLMSRGGNPDLTDYLGNTALHHSAANGHLPCCSFLVNFGANIWALDNDLHSALDLAVLRNQREVIDFLDSVVGKQRALNKRMVLKLQQRSVEAAEKRRKQYEKLQAKAQRRLEKEEAIRSKQRQKMAQGGMATEELVSEPTSSRAMSMEKYQAQSVRSYKSIISPSERSTFTDEHNRQSITSGYSGAGGPGGINSVVAKKVGKKKSDQISSKNSDFYVTEDRDGHKSVRSLTGLKRDSQIMYATSADPKNLYSRDERTSRAFSEPEFMNDDEANKASEAGLFERPGFGSVSFLSKPTVSDALMSLPGDGDKQGDQNGDIQNIDESGRSAEVERTHSCSDSIGTAGSLLKRMVNLPWSEDEVENLDDDQVTDDLELFLACHCLTEYTSVFTKEKIDMDALLLCDDEDLKKIGLHLGPRKKILDSIEKRKITIQQPGRMFDTCL